MERQIVAEMLAVLHIVKEYLADVVQETGSLGGRSDKLHATVRDVIAKAEGAM